MVTIFIETSYEVIVVSLSFCLVFGTCLMGVKEEEGNWKSDGIKRDTEC